MGFTYSVFICVLGLTHEGWSEYGDRIKNATVVWGDNLQMEESRHGGYAIAAPPTDLPVTYQAPYINAPNYWSSAGRRTVLDYQPYVGQDIITRPITEGINTFYGLMNQFFGTEEPLRRPQPPPPPPYQQPVKPRPDFEYPYHPQNLRPFYLPGPKPLRASIQKLEPPRNNFSPVERPNNYPQFVKILNDVLLENAYNYREPVIEKPVYEYDNIIPTTYKPNHFKVRATSSLAPFPVSIQDQLPPVKSGQDTRIPYVTETTTVQTIRPTSDSKIVFPADSGAIPTPADFSIDVRNANAPIAGIIAETTTAKAEPSTTHPPTTPIVEVTTNGDSGINANHSDEKNTTEKLSELVPVQHESSSDGSEKDNIVDTKKDDLSSANPTESSLITTTDVLTTTTVESVTKIPILSSSVPLMVTELLDTMEPLQNDRMRSQYPKKLNSRKVTTDATNSADYVTDLTLRGLNDSNAVHVSVPKRFKPFNMSFVLDYVIGELNATAPPINATPDDGLSLDAKILRDTHWDGYQPVIPTTEMVTETTTVLLTLPTTTDTPTKETTEPIKFEEETTIVSPRNKRLRVVTTTPVVPTRKSLRTTTIYPTAITTSYPMTTTEYVTLPFEKQTEIIATRVTQTVSKSLRQRQRSRTTTTEESVISPRGLDQENSSTEFTSTTRKGRKYQRKPKSYNFTQFSSKSTTQTPNKLATTVRTFYPKRSRLNATSTLNNREKKISNEEEKKPKKISPAEDQTARRNLYKRRKYPSQRRTTEESLVES